MFRVIMALGFSLAAVPGWAQEQPTQEKPVEPQTAEQSQESEPAKEQGVQHIPAKEAKLHVGETLAVCGNVASGVYNRKSQQKNTYLNFDKPFPDTTFTVVINRKNRKHFDYKPEKLEGQWICAYGLIIEFRGHAQVNVGIPEQIIAQEYPD